MRARGICVAVATSVALLAGLRSVAVAAGAEAELSPRLAAAISMASPGDTLHVWAFFDARPLSPEERSRALREAEGELDPHARWRRLHRGHGPIVTERDLPLPESYLAALREAGAELRARSRWLCAASFSGTPDVVRRVARLPCVEGLRLVGAEPAAERLPSPAARRLPGPHSPARAPRTPLDLSYDYGLSWGQLHQIQVPALHALGYTGTGVRMAMLDTGFRRSHEALAPLHVIAEWDFVYDDSVTANEPGQDTEWQDYHGTLTWSLAGAYAPGTMLGPAFGADFILAKTEVLHYEHPVEEDYWVEGIEWAESLGAEVVSSSLGYFDFDRGYPDYTYQDMDGDTAVTTIAADLAVSLGVVVVNCLGNYGDNPDYYMKMIAPSDGDSVLGIGAVDSAGVVTPYSSLGPTYDGRIKPDLLARGDIDICAYSADPHGYTSETGTSCSTPLAGGVATLLLQAHPEWGPVELGDLLKQTATRSSAPDTVYGWGLIQALDALLRGEGTEVSAGEALAGDSPVPRRPLAVYPNPWRDEVHILLDAPCARAGLAGGRAGQPATVAIYDAGGRRVRRQVVSLPGPGETRSLDWDGRDEAGRAVPAGLYVVEVRSGPEAASAKILRLR